MRDLPALPGRRSTAGALTRSPVLSRPARPGGGVTALLAAAVLSLTAGVSLRSAHRLLPDPED